MLLQCLILHDDIFVRSGREWKLFIFIHLVNLAVVTLHTYLDLKHLHGDLDQLVTQTVTVASIGLERASQGVQIRLDRAPLIHCDINLQLFSS